MHAINIVDFMERRNKKCCLNRVLSRFLFVLSFTVLQLKQKGHALLATEDENVLEIMRTRFPQLNWTDDPCLSGWTTCSNTSSSGNATVLILNVQRRELNGTLPSALSNLTSLQELNLNDNQLTGRLPDVSRMGKLTILYLNSNQFSGRILDTVALTNVSKINLGGNNLTGGIQASVFDHTTLKILDLSSNSLGGRIPDMSNLTGIDSLSLASTKINGSIPETIRFMSRATIINLSDNPQLTGTIPDLNDLVLLRYFDASNCGLSGTLPDLKASNGLEGLYLQGNDFSGSIPLELFQHEALQWLHLSNNTKLSGQIPDMSGLGGVELLDIADCNFSGPIPQSLQKALKLRFLYAKNNKLTSFPLDLRNLTKLVQLNLENNSFTGRLPDLPAGSTQTSSEGYRLKSIIFTDNNFDGEIPESWSQLSHLEQMTLPNNNLTGVMPRGLGNLTTLTELNLRNNFFSGSIPEELGNLTNLENLDLRNNRLNGTVPETLAKLTKLKSLRLDNNRLTGIPEALLDRDWYITWTGNPNLKIIKPSDASSSSTFPTAAIVGVVVGGVGAAIAVLVLAALFLSKRRKNGYEDQLSREDMPKSAQAFSLKQIKSITENNKTTIGKGGFGPVYYGKLADGKEVAVKVRASDSKQGAGEFLNEVRLLSRLHHRNLVPLVGYCLEAQQQILVYVYMPQGTLHDHLYHTGKNSLEPVTLDWKTRLGIVINAARGLEYLHKDCNPPVIHRDVKSSNILLTDKLQAKVADLGISKQVHEPNEELELSGVSTAIKGTFGYLDPEYFVRRKLTTKSDVYSFGMVLLEIITGKRPQSQKFPGSMETNMIDWVREMLNSDQVDAIVDPFLAGQYHKEGMLRVAQTAMSCVVPAGADRPEMGDIVRSLIEVLEMEGECISHSQHFPTESTVAFSGHLNNPFKSNSDSSVSSAVYTHPSWSTDPR